MPPSFADLIDFSIVRPLMQSFFRTSHLPMAILDQEGKVLATSGWQKVCTYYHRRFPLSLQRCVDSDTEFSNFLREGRPPATGDHFESFCRNGLVHIGFPIVIEGEHLATLFLSQFFYDPPDLEHFRHQARELEIAEEFYLEAVKKVPILDRARVGEILGFYSGFARLLARLGAERLRQIESRHQLEASERKFRSIFESALDSIVLVAADGRLLEANRQTFINLGYRREELLALTKSDIHAPTERQRLREYVDRVIREGSDRMETVQLRKDGTLLPVEISGRRVDFMGEPAVLCLTRDITERTQAEDGLKRALAATEEAREKLDAILESVGDGLLVTDPADRIVLMNRAAQNLLGISPAVPLPRLDEVVAEENLRRQIVATRNKGVAQGPCEWEVASAQSEGALMVQARSMPVHTVQGRVSGIISLLRDVTRERELDRQKDEFISTAAHELRTPLTAVMGFVELLLQHNEHGFSLEERREFLQLIYQKSEVLAHIIEDLLDLSRIRSGHMITLKKSREDLWLLVTRAVDAYRKISGRHDFVLDLPEVPFRLMLDAGKIGQVLENLLSNAVKFSPRGGRITVSGRCSAGEVRVTVADEGIGMTPRQMERIFDKFYRVDASTTAAAGLGLGMSIARSIVQAHRGHIWIESEPGRGTRVHFTLPLKAPTDVPEAPEEN